MPTKEQLIKWMKQNGWHYWYCASCQSVQCSYDVESVIKTLSQMTEINFEQLVNEIKQIKV